jgi:hypothetical protein
MWTLGSIVASRSGLVFLMDCLFISLNQLLVHGPGVVVPSTFEEIEHGLIYSVVVMLSTQVPSGKVTVVMARRPCADAAGNLFERTANSSFVIRFGTSIQTFDTDVVSELFSHFQAG